MRINLPKLPPLAAACLKSQAIGALALTALKIFPLCNPQLGFAIAAAVYLTDQLARHIFRKLFAENRPLSEYGYALAFSVLSLHMLTSICCPEINSVLADVSYISSRTFFNLAYALGKAVYQTYLEQKKPIVAV